jgi:SAM-dependent methyltransferase
MLFSNETLLAPIMLKLTSRRDLEVKTPALREARLFLEDALAQAGSAQSEWALPGFCEVCGRDSAFILDWRYATGSLPNFRERLVCPHCGLNSRQRFVLGWIKGKYKERREKPPGIYFYEQVTPFFHGALRYLTGCRIIGSEYLGFDKKSGDVVRGLRHEDALALSFPDASLDLLVSNDVFEHVPDHRRALSEAARVLAPGGAMIFSVPFHTGEDQTRARAELGENGLRHLLPEQYHGNPVSEKGSLVFHDFGWDLLAHCREAGFAEAYALFYHDLRCGYLGDGGQMIFMAEK